MTPALAYCSRAVGRSAWAVATRRYEQSVAHPFSHASLHVMRPQCAGLMLNANGDAARLNDFGLPVVADDVAGFKGPLAGILAGLDWIALHRPNVDFAVSVPTDTPFLPVDLVARLREGLKKNNAEIVCASSGGVTHPVIALWPVGIRTDLRHALVDEDLRKIDRFTQRYRVATVDWPVDPYDPFFNANEPGDLAMAEAICAEVANGFLPDTIEFR